MHIRIALEAEDNEIKFERRDKREQITEYNVADISLENIAETINNAKKEAQVAIEKLRMKSSIKEFWDNPPLPKFETDDDDESEEEMMMKKEMKK